MYFLMILLLSVIGVVHRWKR